MTRRSGLNLLKRKKKYVKIQIKEQTFERRKGDIKMNSEYQQELKREQYRKAIRILIEKSKDLDYIKAVYSFASTYPDKTKENRN